MRGGDAFVDDHVRRAMDNGYTAFAITVDVEMMEPGQTRIAEPSGLDLREREIESIYLEAVRP